MHCWWSQCPAIVTRPHASNLSLIVAGGLRLTRRQTVSNHLLSVKLTLTSCEGWCMRGVGSFCFWSLANHCRRHAAFCLAHACWTGFACLKRLPSLRFILRMAILTSGCFVGLQNSHSGGSCYRRTLHLIVDARLFQISQAKQEFRNDKGVCQGRAGPFFSCRS